MIYTLCHKNIPVLRFKLEEDDIREIISIENGKHIPTGLFFDYETELSDRQQFSNWWKSRSIPASRQNLRTALELLGNTTTEHLLTQSFGLSLSDHYWAKPDTCNLTWEQVNFFQNDFSEDVGKALFGTLKSKSKWDINLVSPDNTSDGWLKKKWIIQNHERILLKGGSELEEQEPFNEVLASEICKRLNIPHVDYNIVKDGTDYYSACQTFITPDTEFIPAEKIYKTKKYTGGLWDKYNHFKDCCNSENINFAKLEKQLCCMFVVDFIVANIDRHLSNFGFIRNPDTLEWLGLAPVFDTGSSMFYKVPDNLLSDKNSVDSVSILARPFGYKQSDQIKLLPCKKLCSDLPLEKLKDISEWFEELLIQNERISSERRRKLCMLLKERVIETERIIKG